MEKEEGEEEIGLKQENEENRREGRREEEGGKKEGRGNGLLVVSSG